MDEESEDAQTVVDRDEHNILGAPFLSVELGFRAPALTETAPMNPQGHGQFLVDLARSLRPNVKV